MPESSLLRDILILFGLGVLVVLAFHRARLPPIVGFLMTGVLCGPYGFRLIRNVADVEAIAEVGVILLLFTIGIEFSVQQLVRLRSFLLLGGTFQVAGTVGAIYLVARAFGETGPVSVFLGMLVALSSTAIVLRFLTDRGELDAPHGQAALAILIFQDLCVVPMVLVTPLLAGHAPAGESLPGTLGRVVLFALAAFVAARWIFPWVLEQVVATRKREVFLLAIIFLCLGTAWATAQIGLSLALGAFIAGLVISRSEYSHQALGEVLPLREVFNALFFVSIGMLFDARVVLRDPFTVLAAIAGVIVLKGMVAAGAAFALGQSIRVAALSGLAIAQIGEFSFVLSRAGLAAGVIDERHNQLLLAIAVGTMALTPGLLSLAPRVAGWMESRAPRRWVTGRSLPLADTGATHLGDHVVIVGYGLNGRNLARVLGRTGIPFIVVEMNPDVVRAERARGRSIIYGDATRPEILHHAELARARVLVIAVSDPAATRSMVAIARRLAPTVHIVVRSRYVSEMEKLVALGTDEVVPEEYETSLEISSRVLHRYAVPRDQIDDTLEEMRRAGYASFRSSAEPAVAGRLDRLVSGLAVEAVRVEKGSAVAGLTLAECGIRERTGATIAALQREGETKVNPSGTTMLHPGATVLLLGEREQVRAALPYFRANGASGPDERPPRDAWGVER